MKYSGFWLLSSAFILLALPAHAQRFETQQIYQRLGQMEKNIGLMQRQLATGAAPSAPGTVATAGQMGAEIARIDEEMRSLRGQIEQLTFQVDQTNKQLTKMQEDMDFRFRELEQRAAAAPAATAAEPMAEEAADAPAPALQDELETVARSQPEGKLAIPAEGDPVTPRDLYNHAFKLLNQTNYKGAEQAFLKFTTAFPKDPLIGNSWYWLGESYYVQRDYAKAADSFRNGYQTLPDGPKAGDNLLKLAMTLSALDRGKDACVVLAQVKKKFAVNSEALGSKAKQEMARLKCQ